MACLCVVTPVNPAKMDKPIEMVFGEQSCVPKGTMYWKGMLIGAIW